MFKKLFSIEWTRLTHRALLWFTLAICAFYIGLSQANFYATNHTQILDGALKMPGMSFDLATSLDQLAIAIPFLVIIAASLMGNDYSQRTNQHWLRRAPRSTSLLAKFAILVVLILVIQVITLIVGGLVGYYYKTFVYHMPDSLNLNWLATLAAPFYMTLVNLPYIALTFLVTVMVRSTFLSIVLGLGYTQFLEFLMAGIFFGKGWTKWLFTNLHFSATFLLNSIGNRTADIPARILDPVPAFITAVAYTLILIAAAAWLYRRQDLGG